MAKTPAERRLLAEAVVALGVASFAIALLPFRKVASAPRRPEGALPSQREQLRHIDAVRWAVLAAARRVPWRAKCIEQGFAAQWMLRRRAVPSVLHYGVSRRDGGLVAHVWVRSGATDVVGCDNLNDYAEIARFPSGPSEP